MTFGPCLTRAAHRPTLPRRFTVTASGLPDIEAAATAQPVVVGAASAVLVPVELQVSAARSATARLVEIPWIASLAPDALLDRAQQPCYHFYAC